MKRTIILLAALAVAVFAASAQTKIQNRFLGLEIGQTYSDMLEIPELGGCRSRDCRTDDRQEHTFVEQFKNLRDIRFGGRVWSNFRMFFSPSGTFYMVGLSNGYGTPGEAGPEYQALLRDLDSKYGHVKGIVRKEKDSKDGSRKSVSYTGSDGMACMVSLYQSEGMNNSMYWYVTLDYWREDLKAAAQEEIIREM